MLVVVLCLLCGTFTFAYQARPYAFLLAADMAALLCWANLVEGRHKRTLTAFGLFLGIAFAVGSHWFGFLVLVPLVIGEVIRTWQERRIDAVAWTAMFAGGVTSLAYLPLLKAAVQYRALPWKGVQLEDISDSFQLILKPCLVPLILLLIISVLTRFLINKPPVRVGKPSIPVPVFICTVFFALAPFLGFLVGKFVSHAFQPRYVLFCTIGLIFILALAIRDFLGDHALRMASAVLVLALCVLILEYRALSAIPAGGDAAAFADVTVFSAEPLLPVVPSGDGLLLRLESHAPSSLRERCMFPTDPDFVRLSHQNTYFLMTEALRRWTKLPITDLTPFLKAHPQFYFIQLTGRRDWLLQRLLEDRADITLQGTYAGNPVYLVDMRY